jgi:hypothetical protein
MLELTVFRNVFTVYSPCVGVGRAEKALGGHIRIEQFTVEMKCLFSRTMVND